MPLSVITQRDLEILGALARVPLTAFQLQRLSETFLDPFSNVRLLRRRLQQLHESGLVRRATYTALAGRGGVPNYYLLTPAGYRMLNGFDAQAPSKRFGLPVALPRQRHTHALAEFIVHLLRSVHHSGVAVTGFCAENTVCLTDGTQHVYPDCSFQIIADAAPPLSFFVEIDNHTERLCTVKDVESWERKLRVYESVLDRAAVRFRVLALTTVASPRTRHILALGAKVARNPMRSMLYVGALPDFLATPAPLRAAFLYDHRGERVSLLPPVRHAVSA